KGVSSTDDQHAAALERAGDIRAFLRDKGWPEPIHSDSGNGAHLMYRVDLPNDAASSKLVERALAALAARFDDQRVSVDRVVHNASRIWKIPGTLACKGDDTAAQPHRRSRLIDAPTEFGVVSRELLLELGGEALEDERSPDSRPSDDRTAERARAYLAKVPPAISDQAGGKHTFLVAEHLTRGF